jgi:hypothetical protein
LNWTLTPTWKIRGAILPSRAKRSGDADTVTADGQSLDRSDSVGAARLAAASKFVASFKHAMLRYRLQ